MNIDTEREGSSNNYKIIYLKIQVVHMAETPRFSSTCPICDQGFDNVEEHISKDHCKDQVDLGFIKWVMRIHKKVEDYK
jgi:hypothetical protein